MKTGLRNFLYCFFGSGNSTGIIFRMNKNKPVLVGIIISDKKFSSRRELTKPLCLPIINITNPSGYNAKYKIT